MSEVGLNGTPLTTTQKRELIPDDGIFYLSVCGD